MKKPKAKPAFAGPAGSACCYTIVATTETEVRTFEGAATTKPGQCATLDQLLICVISGIVREEKLVLLGLTIEASLESPNAVRSTTPGGEA